MAVRARRGRSAPGRSPAALPGHRQGPGLDGGPAQADGPRPGRVPLLRGVRRRGRGGPGGSSSPSCHPKARGGARDRPGHRLVDPAPGRRPARDLIPGRLGRVRGPGRAGRRDPRPVREPGDRPRRMAGPRGGRGRGPGHRRARRGAERGRGCADDPVVERLRRGDVLGHLRRFGRRPRGPPFPRRPAGLVGRPGSAPAGRDAPPRPGRAGDGPGLLVHGRGRRPGPVAAPRHPGLVRQAPARLRPRRRRGRERRRDGGGNSRRGRPGPAPDASGGPAGPRGGGGRGRRVGRRRGAPPGERRVRGPGNQPGRRALGPVRRRRRPGRPRSRGRPHARRAKPSCWRTSRRSPRGRSPAGGPSRRTAWRSRGASS